jgi:heterodisulfide reductase subunit C
MADILEWRNTALLEEVERRSGSAVSACVQCHKCSTGCPIGPEMDLLSSQVMRLVQLGEAEEVLGSRAIWLCASCAACTTRCPMDIDVAGVMDTLRIMAVERQAATADTRGQQFNRSFLGSVRRHGRVFELGMLAVYKLRSGRLLTDITKLPQMLAKGKISLLPSRSAEAQRLREVFRRAQEADEEEQGQ